MNVMLYTDPDWTETQDDNFASNDGSRGSAEQVALVSGCYGLVFTE